MRENVAEPPPGRTGAGGSVPDRRPGARPDGLAGPTRRFAVIVVLLVALASLPTLAAIRAGSRALEHTDGAERTTPFIAQPAHVPVVVVPAPTLAPAPPRQAPSRAAEPARARPRPDRTVGRPATGTRYARPSRPRRVESTPVPQRRTPTRDAGSRPAAGGAARPSSCGSAAALGWRPLGGAAPSTSCG